MDQFSNYLNFILDLNKAVFRLQATSFTIMALAVLSMCCLVNRSNDDDDDDEGGCLVMCLGCNVVLYPIGGKLLGF
jgi:hypothetical protein